MEQTENGLKVGDRVIVVKRNLDDYDRSIHELNWNEVMDDNDGKTFRISCILTLTRVQLDGAGSWAYDIDWLDKIEFDEGDQVKIVRTEDETSNVKEHLGQIGIVVGVLTELATGTDDSSYRGSCAEVKFSDGPHHFIYTKNLEKCVIETDFKIGDEVKLLQGRGNGESSNVDWVGAMNLQLGKITKITKVYNGYVKVERNDWDWDFSWLEKVNKTGFKLGDEVEYVGLSEHYADTNMIGSRGIVVKIEMPAGQVKVKWKIGHHAGEELGHYPDNLKIITKQIAIIPTPKKGVKLCAIVDGVYQLVDAKDLLQMVRKTKRRSGR